MSGADVEGFVFETSGQVNAGRALFHTGAEQVTTQHNTIQHIHTRVDFYENICSSCLCVFSEKRIRYDHYLIPFTLYELGLLYKQQGNYIKATRYIEDAK